jgi:ATPase family associated with various cellular activities (AAA)
MQLSQLLREYITAAFSGIWIQSHEHEDALREIAQLCRGEKWPLATWDVDRGLQLPGNAAANAANDPIAAIKSVIALATPEGSALLVLPNFHRFLQSTEVVQALAHQVQAGKHNRTFLLILSPVVQVPVELEKSFVIIEHDLPDRQQLQKIAEGIGTENGELPKGEDLRRLIDAAAGLTRVEAEGAFSLSLVRHGKLQPEAVWELKSGMLKKSGLLQLHRGSETFADLGGLDALKLFCQRALQPRQSAARARGVLLLSPPGCGKSQFAKALGNEVGRPTLLLDVGALLGSLVGQTEERIRQALRIADAMSPCILFLDEVEKALSGASSSTDSGVSARLFGTFLTWLSDHTSDVFTICTANDISKLPPEFARAERFDAVFFIDLPGNAEKEKIWPIHLGRYGLADGTRERRPEDRNWTGAEIQSCCRLASLLDLPLKEAAKNVVPVAVTAAESVEKLRAWAAGRCLDASQGGIYTRGAAESASAGRRVSRPSSN